MVLKSTKHKQIVFHRIRNKPMSKNWSLGLRKSSTGSLARAKIEKKSKAKELFAEGAGRSLYAFQIT